jgi:hypothetical protein
MLKANPTEEPNILSPEKLIPIENRFLKSENPEEKPNQNPNPKKDQKPN